MAFPWDDELDSDDGFSRLAAWAAPTPTLAGRLARARPGWFDRAACAGLDPDLFFPDAGASGLAAKGVCSTCPVSEPCGAMAIENSERFGIWAGLNPGDRAARLRRVAPRKRA